MASSIFDPGRYRWRKTTGGEPELGYNVHHDYTILGYDLGAGTLDMLVRWYGDGGHCHFHRHTATTTVLVLEGEQHLVDVHPDGTRGAERVRLAGDYALSVGDVLPHFESGGPDGGIAFFGCHSENGKLYEVLDEQGSVIVDVTMELLIQDFEANT